MVLEVLILGIYCSEGANPPTSVSSLAATEAIMIDRYG
jgi:hypothetical protein